MSRSSGYIKLGESDFPARLRRLRTERSFTKSELADLAELSERTVHDLENGRRPRILQHTAMQLAKALDVTLDDLLGIHAESTAAGQAVEVRSRPRARSVVAGLAVAITMLGAAWFFSTSQATWRIDGTTLTAWDGLLGLEIWSFEDPAGIRHVDVAPWSSRDLLVGLSYEDLDGGRLLCLDRRTGAIRWTVSPDVPTLVQAFGPEDVMDGTFTCLATTPIDMDGDGRLEIVAEFVHRPWYPTEFARIDRHGNVLNRYRSKGHISQARVVDLDDDGRQELLLAGTNNSAHYRGATVILLDEHHFAGATVDSLCACPGVGQLPDSSRARVVFPAFPPKYQALMNNEQLGTKNLELFRGPDDRPLLRAEIGCNGDSQNTLFVTLDQDLTPLRADIQDAFAENIRRTWPDSLQTLPGPADPEWRRRWLERSSHFLQAGP